MFDVDIPSQAALVLFFGRFDRSFVFFPDRDGVALQLQHFALVHLA